MSDRYVVVREGAARDLIDVARQGADLLAGRSSDILERTIADALRGAAAEVAVDIAEPMLL